MNRENGLQEIFNRIKESRTSLGVKTFKWTPTNPIQESDMPCIFLLEGTDQIVKHSSRSNTGFPAKRVMEVILELVTSKDTDIKTMYRNLRKVVFTKRGTDPSEYSSVIANNVFIQESRSEGPEGYGLPNVRGMRLVLDMVYTDENF
jgi:hypothetical protein